MSREPQSSGKCELCGSSFKKGSMAKHLQTCLTKAQEKHKGNATPKWLLKIDGGGPYWLFVQIKSNATLEDLDKFLRKIWLECCGHLSLFEINGTRYSGCSDEFGDEFGDEEGFEYLVKDLFEPKMQIEYEYDFGSTTDLIITALSEQKTPGQKKVMLLARNDAPEIACSTCGKPSIEICSECIWEGEGLICEDCLDEHECDNEMFLPLVNSPRTGVCGYAG